MQEQLEAYNEERRQEEYFKDENDKIRFNESRDIITGIQAQIDKCAKNASLRISELAARMENQMRLHRDFIRAYAMEHLPRNPNTGEIKKKFVRDEYGGVFFRATPEKFEIDDLETLVTLVRNKRQPELMKYFKFKAALNCDTAGLQRLFDLLNQQEREAVGFRKIEGDEFGKMNIGATSGWSSANAAKLITKAIKATEYKENAEDEEADQDGIGDD